MPINEENNKDNKEDKKEEDKIEENKDKTKDEKDNKEEEKPINMEEIEKKKKIEEQKDKEKKQKESKNNVINVRGSCMLPTTTGFKNLIQNMENKDKKELNTRPQIVPKKLKAMDFKRKLGERFIGQFIKKPSELNKKEEQTKTPSPASTQKTTPKEEISTKSKASQEIQNTPKPTPTPTPTPKPPLEKRENNFDPSKLYKSETVMFEKEMQKYYENEKTDLRKNSEEKKSSKRNSSLADNFGFEVLESFDDSKLTANTSNDNISLNEGFLDPTNYEEYLSELKQQGIKESPRETFCEGFFIASFPKENGQVIENSAEKLPASCGHDECSKLSSMKPEIIMRYPLKDTKNLELNNLAATICFPTGIKLCYSESEEPQKIKDYVTQITNQKGERYYMRTFHFYHRMQNSEFTKEYKMHPLKHHLMILN